MNRVTLIGNLGRDAERLSTQGGTTILKFSMATTRRVKRDEQWEDEVEWHRVVVFGRTAEAIADYMVKGKQVGIEGRLHTSSWERDGKKHYMTEVVAENVELLGGPRDSGGDRAEPRPKQRSTSRSGGSRGGGGRRQGPTDDGMGQDVEPDPPPSGPGAQFSEDDVPF